MKQYAFILTALTCIMYPSAAATEERVLARLTFRVSPAQMATFEAAYPTQIAPLLKRHGLVALPKQNRAMPDSVFSRVFVLPHPAAIIKKRRALARNRSFTETTRSLGAVRGTFAFRAYSVPAQFGKTVPAGSGTVQIAGPGKGFWQTYSEADGLATVSVYETYQDQKGYLWFCTTGGVSRYDGANWTTFDTTDGLAGSRVHAIIEDQKGHLWFGTLSYGVSRYDGTHWTTFNTTNGLAANSIATHAIVQDRKGHLWFGTANGVSRYDGTNWTTFNTRNGLANNQIRAITQDNEGHLWFGTANGVSRYDGTNWTTFNTTHGLANNRISAITQDHKGHLYFGTFNGEVSRYDGTNFTTVKTTKNLANSYINAITQDREGYLWFSTEGSGVSRYDGANWTTFSTADGLANNEVRAVTQDREGHLWFSTMGGASRYDASTFTTFDTADGLANSNVLSIAQDQNGHLWFGTRDEGVSRYDGKTFTTFTQKDGLSNNQVRAIFEDQKGHMWFGTTRGVSRYDGKTFTTFTIANGLANNWVNEIIEDQNGHLWFVTRNGINRYDGSTLTTFLKSDGLSRGWVTATTHDREGGLWFGMRGSVSRYDGKTFTTLKIDEQVKGWWPNGFVHTITQDQAGDFWFGGQGGVCHYNGQTWTLFDRPESLGGSIVWSALQDTRGHFWFGTTGGGVSRYDGQAFQTLINHDGLPDNVVQQIFQDQNDNLWFGTQRGVTRYRSPPQVSPPIIIDAVVADQKYTAPDTVQFPNTVSLVRFEFHGVSFKTRPEAMVYRYRLRGKNNTWKTTRDRRVEYESLQTGSYTFEIQAIDRDLTYSKRATVTLFVEPPFYFQAHFFIPIAGGGTLLLTILIFQTVSLLQRRRQVTNYQQAAVAELGDAREMQLSLLPKSPPQIEGFDIAGLCDPATDVGGDYYTYCHLNGTDENLSIVLMDVTGHGMRAATTTFLANGMLQSEIRNQQSPGEIFTQMHQSLKGVLPKRSYVATALAHINLKDRILTHYNAGIPEPILWRNGQSVSLKFHNTRPLGGPLTPEFESVSIPLQSKDIILFFTDGLTEASNQEGSMYGEQRLSAFLTSLNTQEQNAHTYITALQKDVQTFVGSTELEDDLTIVGVHIL